MNSSDTDIQCWRGSLSCTLSPGISRCFPSLPQLPWKSLASVVQFYYMWKTTDRYIQQVCRQHVVFNGINKHFQTFCFQQKSPALSTSSLRNDWKQQKQTASWSRCTSLPSEYWSQLSSLLVYKFTITIGDHLMCFGLLSQRSQRSHDTICIQHQRHNKGGRRGDCCQTLWPQRSVFVSPGFNHGVDLFLWKRCSQESLMPLSSQWHAVCWRYTFRPPWIALNPGWVCKLQKRRTGTVVRVSRATTDMLSKVAAARRGNRELM